MSRFRAAPGRSAKAAAGGDMYGRNTSGLGAGSESVLRVFLKSGLSTPETAAGPSWDRSLSVTDLLAYIERSGSGAWSKLWALCHFDVAHPSRLAVLTPRSGGI